MWSRREEPFAFHPILLYITCYRHTHQGHFSSKQHLRLKTLNAFAVSSVNMATLVCKQPRIITLGKYVHSAVNFGSFLKWAKTASEGDLKAAVSVVYMTTHYWFDEDFSVPELPPKDINFIRDDLGLGFRVRQRMCEDPLCDRCLKQQGGFHFRFVGPWTCQTCLGDENTPPQEIGRRAYECGCGKH